MHQHIAAKLAQEGLAQGGLVRLRVSGNSMAPLIESGDVVLVRHADPESLHRGDLLLVEREGAFLVHRLVAIGARGIQTKGDNSSHADLPVTPQAILGRVVAVEKGGKRIELDEGRWPMVNRTLGLLGWCEARIFALGRMIERKLARGDGRWPRGLASLGAAPFRWLTRLLIGR